MRAQMLYDFVYLIYVYFIQNNHTATANSESDIFSSSLPLSSKRSLWQVGQGRGRSPRERVILSLRYIAQGGLLSRSRDSREKAKAARTERQEARGCRGCGSGVWCV